MGIYDREYYRDERSSFLRAFAGRGQVCKWLIAANVVCFVIQVIPIRAFQEALWLTEQSVFSSGQVWRVLTYAFLHDPNSLLHIVFNMLFLWWFGNDVEDIYGPREFLAFYLTSAALGGLAFVGWQWRASQADPMAALASCVGASGAVTAVMVLFALHYPTQKILVWFVIPIPIWVFVAFQVVQDTLIFVGGQRTTTAVTVHLAGALFGFVYFKRQWRLLSFLPEMRAWQRQRSRPRLRVYREESHDQPISVTASTKSDVDEHLEAKVDAVLEKVAKLGQQSLTESERQILLRASEVYRKRRN